jgi:hypothetical protein
LQAVAAAAQVTAQVVELVVLQLAVVEQVLLMVKLLELLELQILAAAVAVLMLILYRTLIQAQAVMAVQV